VAAAAAAVVEAAAVVVEEDEAGVAGEAEVPVLPPRKVNRKTQKRWRTGVRAS
jgi:hypothetical protein